MAVACWIMDAPRMRHVAEADTRITCTPTDGAGILARCVCGCTRSTHAKISGKCQIMQFSRVASRVRLALGPLLGAHRKGLLTLACMDETDMTHSIGAAGYHAALAGRGTWGHDRFLYFKTVFGDKRKRVTPICPPPQRRSGRDGYSWVGRSLSPGPSTWQTRPNKSSRPVRVSVMPGMLMRLPAPTRPPRPPPRRSQR